MHSSKGIYYLFKQMGPKKVEKREELVKSVGIITIKTVRETMPYTIKGIIILNNNDYY